LGRFEIFFYVEMEAQLASQVTELHRRYMHLLKERVLKTGILTSPKKCAYLTDFMIKTSPQEKI
jgi:hypothetical protein